MSIVKIGNPRGRIALYLDETEAIDLAYKYGLDDLGARELLDAVEQAYPPESDGPRLGIRIGMRADEHGRLAPGFEVTCE